MIRALAAAALAAALLLHVRRSARGTHGRALGWLMMLAAIAGLVAGPNAWDAIAFLVGLGATGRYVAGGGALARDRPARVRPIAASGRASRKSETSRASTWAPRRRDAA